LVDKSDNNIKGIIQSNFMCINAALIYRHEKGNVVNTIPFPWPYTKNARHMISIDAVMQFLPFSQKKEEKKLESPASNLEILVDT